MSQSLYIGLMSGTSLDSVDAVVVDLDSPAPRLIDHHSLPIPEAMFEMVEAIGNSAIAGDPILLFGQLDQQFGHLFADAVLALLDKSGIQPADIAAIGSHGQTVWHQPDGDYPFTLQIGDPNLIAERCSITTIADFRRRDIAAGGQGAPLVPAFHAAILATGQQSRVVVNIGGIANITTLAPDEVVSGYDTGPGNLLLDLWASQQGRGRCDRNGEWAASGVVDHRWLEQLLGDPYFTRPPPKSTGRERFNLHWLQQQLMLGAPSDPAAVQATLSELTAITICRAVARSQPGCELLIVCGGGVHNLDLIRRIERLIAPTRVVNSDQLGVDPDWIEAIAFAWLARQTLHHRPGNLPAVTGARHPVVLGAIYHA